MIGDFSDKTKAPEGFSDKVATCLFPNDSVYVSGQTGFAIGNNGKDKVDAAMKLVKFFQDPEIQAEIAVKLGVFPDAPVTFTDAQKAEAPLLIDAINVTSSAKLKILQNYQSAWYTNVCDSFTTLYPQLIYNKITPEDFAKQLTEIAQKNQ
jgi:raffinose/stachyose/melibiose transport system substrate-binding protein